MKYQLLMDDSDATPYLAVDARGKAILQDAFLNKGDAFTRDEREALGLVGFLPDHVSTIDEQLARVRYQYGLKTSEIGKNVFLNELMDRNETLFYRFVLDDLAGVVPVIYTPTIVFALEPQLQGRPRVVHHAERPRTDRPGPPRPSRDEPPGDCRNRQRTHPRHWRPRCGRHGNSDRGTRSLHGRCR